MSMYDDILNKHSDKIDKWLGIGYSSNFPYLEREFYWTRSLAWKNWHVFWLQYHLSLFLHLV